ncbi:MAG: MgtC/SapB family protein [Betaproteobacteria bacterium]|nr:MgtC/SapB family protein [Betaproteobacteria bacterium]
MHGSGLEHLPAFLTSLAIGLLIGLERERRPEAKAGLRTFALVAVFGTVAGMLSDRTESPWMLLGGLLVVGFMTVAAYFREREAATDPGTTTVVAIVVCYGLGALIWYGYGTLAVMLAITTTILLYFRAELRGITQALTRQDLVSMLQFAVLSFIVLPILPNRNYGPYEALNPHQVWLMVVLISGVSLAGYVALRVFGQKKSAPLLGALGGLVSSTATTLVYARHAGNNDRVLPLAVVVILLANLVVMVRLGVISAIAAPAILTTLLPVLGTGLLFGLAWTAFAWRRLNEHREALVPPITNPTELKTSLGFGALYAVVLFFAAWLSDIAGSSGLYAVAVLSGLTDVDAITLSSLRLFDLGKLTAFQAVTSIAVAVVSNIGFKLGLVLFIGGAPLARRCATGMGAVALGTVVALGAVGA